MVHLQTTKILFPVCLLAIKLLNIDPVKMYMEVNCGILLHFNLHLLYIRVGGTNNRHSSTQHVEMHII